MAARGLWRGSISFGLINIPVSVVSAESPESRPIFNLIDKRDHGHIGYLKINKNTGKPVDNRHIVKALRLESGKYSIFDQDELARMHLKGNDSIELQQFVDQDDVEPSFFEKPYYLLPEKGGLKTYVLLRETLKKTRKFGVGLLVMHSKQHLVLIGASGAALFLEVIRYADGLKSQKEYDFPQVGGKGIKISGAELGMAERLVEELSDRWKPSQYKDTFHEQMMKALRRKSKIEVEDAPEPEQRAGESSEHRSKVLDLMPLLEKSLRARRGPAKRKRSA
jgi:DNA end-binding protein Ku